MIAALLTVCGVVSAQTPAQEKRENTIRTAADCFATQSFEKAEGNLKQAEAYCTEASWTASPSLL
jgi:hypothetical protein